MPSDKLTELGIKMSKSGIKQKKLYDGQGLYLLLHPNGSKYWRVKYRFLGKEKVLSLGVYLLKLILSHSSIITYITTLQMVKYSLFVSNLVILMIVSSN